jgi:hypothetical protein
LLKIGCPPPKVAAFTPILWHCAAAIFENINYKHSSKYITTCIAGGFLKLENSHEFPFFWVKIVIFHGSYRRFLESFLCFSTFL